MMDVIKVTGLRKTYGKRSVLKGLDFQVRQGEIFSHCWESTEQEKPLLWSASRDCVPLTEAASL